MSIHIFLTQGKHGVQARLKWCKHPQIFDKRSSEHKKGIKGTEVVSASVLFSQGNHGVEVGL